DLGEAHVELVQAIAEHSVRDEHVDRFLAGGAGAEWTAQDRSELSARLDGAGLNGRAREALEVAADAQAVQRRPVVRDELVLRLRARLLMAVLDRRAAHQLRLSGDEAAVVVHRLAERDAARRGSISLQACGCREVEPIPVL